MGSFTSNFAFLSAHLPQLTALGQLAEKNLYVDPSTTLVKLRIFTEQVVKNIWQVEELPEPEDNSLFARTKELKNLELIPAEINDVLHQLRKMANVSAHDGKGTVTDGKIALKLAFDLGLWFFGTYFEDPAVELESLYFNAPPLEPAATEQLQELEAKVEALQQENEQLMTRLQQNKAAETEEDKKARKSRSAKAVKHLQWSEEQTRKLIDQKLQEAGWEADTVELSYHKGVRPEKGRNMAIAEWPCGTKYVDYALFIDQTLVGLVEAKKYGQDISATVGESKMYAELVEEKWEAELAGKWGTYKVPFLFATNGREYHFQLEHKSGIWFLDARNPQNLSRALRGWYSPEGLKQLLAQDIEAANKALGEDEVDYLSDPQGLWLRYYQVEAIKAVEKKLMENPTAKDRRALLAMATGTGKTRTVLGLAYRLVKSKRFRRILFLVDRSLLGEQSSDVFRTVSVEDLQAFGSIYNLAEMGSILEPETKLHIATVQSMVKRLLYLPEEHAARPNVDDYDCIIIDEAHRGYILDKEMDEHEILFRNEQEYMSTYRQVIDYFDAFKIALTATPAQHTIQIFGEPIYRYTYRQAVIDGFLIDHEPPYIIHTELNKNGIVWEKGEKPKAYLSEEDRIVELDALPDELKIEVEGFNKKVITRPFNEEVAKFLVDHIDPLGQEKTLIFAATDDHADMVVDILKKAYQEKGYPVEDSHIIKITGNSPKPGPQALTNLFKNEKKPSIAVTVDLLTTGVDVPEICNLVFLRVVRSRILYEQMLGRATRLASHIGKETFKIFDAVRLYEALEDLTQMKPVVANPTTTFEQLIEELAQMQEDPLAQQKQLDQVVAKLQRKNRNLSDDQQESFSLKSGGATPAQLIAEIREESNPAIAAQKVLALKELWSWLDTAKKGGQVGYLVSEDPDKFLDYERGYGKGQKPEDYLLSFKEFIEENRNKIAALHLVCTKPKELDRQSLKALRLTLQERGFSDANLKAAWKDTKNEDIAADIIAFIRTMALGSALESREERVKKARKKVRAMHKWNSNQEKWLKRIEDQLINEAVLQPQDFNQPPFDAQGGFEKIDLQMGNQLQQVLDTIQNEMYA
jgi:type I restriction enzyme, R subunit